MKDYQKQALRTASPSFHGHLVHKPRLLQLIAQMKRAGKELDTIKKSLFYGKEYPLASTGMTPVQVKDKQHARLLHSVIGCMTEAAEMADIAFQILKGEQPDLVNFMEEWGDQFWYAAEGLDAAGYTFTEAQKRNIAKLKARYPEQFDSGKAEERDLEAERQILESAE